MEVLYTLFWLGVIGLVVLALRSYAVHIRRPQATSAPGAGRREAWRASEPPAAAGRVGGVASTLPPLGREAPTPAKVAPQPAPLASWWRVAVEHATHVGLVGESQSGKSTTARALLVERARTDQIVIIDPHEKLNDWAGLPVVGTDYDKAACAAAIQALETEMKRRYKRAEAIGDPITVFIDEYPSIVADFPSVRGPFTRLLREAAKVKIRLVIMMQDPSVRTLGIDGEGAVRECFIKVLLGTFASLACPEVVFSDRPAALDKLGRPAPVSVEGLRPIAAQPVTATMWQVPSQESPGKPQEISFQVGEVSIPSESDRGRVSKERESFFVPPAELAQLVLAQQQGKKKTETITAMPSYSGSRHGAYSDAWEAIKRQIEG